MNIVQESTVLLGMVQGEKRQIAQELRDLGVSRPDDEVTTEPQMRALSRNVLLESLERDLIHFIEGWAGEGGK